MLLRRIRIGSPVISATAGSVLFAGTLGVLAQDNATFFWDNTNKRLGINVAAPTAKFDLLTGSSPSSTIGARITIDSNVATETGLIVKDNTNFAHSGIIARFQLVNGSDSGQVLRLDNPGSGLTLNITDGTNSQFTVSKTGATVINEGGGAAADFRVEGDTDQNLIFTKSSSDLVGIGTASPNNKLEIVSTTTPQLRVAYDTSNYVTIATSSTGAITLDATGSGSLFTFNDPISIPFASVADASSDVFKITNTAAPGTISAGRTLYNLNLSLTPTVVVSGTKSFSTTGVQNSIDLSNASITTGNNNSIQGYGLGGVVTGAPTFNGAGTGDTLTVAGVNFVTSISPVLTSVGASAIFTSYGANIGNLSTAAVGASANLTSNAYGIKASVTGDLGTTGINTKIGGYFVATGSSDDNYGIFVDPVTGATNNYGARIDAGSTQTLWISGNADNTTAAAGIAFGSSKDTNLYRSAANTLKTDDSLSIGGGTITLTVDTNFVLSGGVNGVSFDTSTLSIDATNHRVGIGTTTPAQTLDLGSGVLRLGLGASAPTWTSDGFFWVKSAVGNQYDGFTHTFNVGAAARAVAVVIGSTGLVQMAAYGAGAATFDASGNITSVSDERVKNIQGYFTRGLNDILPLKPILFKYNEESKLEMETMYAGFSAQNVKEYIPEAIGKNRDGYYTFNDRPITAALVNAIKELAKRLEVLENAN